jgi:hypothetical protein
MGFNMRIANGYHNPDLVLFQITQSKSFMAKILQIALLQNIKIHKVETKGIKMEH